MLICLLFIPLITAAQSFNQDKATLTNYLKRVYASAPFEGAKKSRNTVFGYITYQWCAQFMFLFT